jgi:hypothetical protein
MQQPTGDDSLGSLDSAGIDGLSGHGGDEYVAALPEVQRSQERQDAGIVVATDVPAQLAIDPAPNRKLLLRAEYERLAAAVKKAERGSPEFNRLMNEKLLAANAWQKCTS